MNRYGQPNRPSPILMVAPTLLVLIAFYAFLFKRTNRELIMRRGDLQNLETEKTSVDLQIESLRKTTAALNQQLQTTRLRQRAIVGETARARRTQGAIQEQITTAVAQAETMSQLMQLFAIHKLAIVGNEASTKLAETIETENQMLLDRLALLTPSSQRRAPVADDDELEASTPATGDGTRFVSSQPPPDSNTAPGNNRAPGNDTSRDADDNTANDAQPLRLKKQYAITLQGGFPNVKNLVREMTESFPHVTIVSVELEKVNLQSDVRNWTLSLVL